MYTADILKSDLFKYDVSKTEHTHTAHTIAWKSIITTKNAEQIKNYFAL